MMTTDEYDRLIRKVSNDLIGWLARIKVCCVAKPGWPMKYAEQSTELLKAEWVNLIAGLNAKTIAITMVMCHPPEPWTIDQYGQQIALEVVELLNDRMELGEADRLSPPDVLLLYDRESPKIPQPSVN